MSKITEAKRARLFETNAHGIEVRRADPKPPAMPRYIMCRKCRGPVRVGVGQIAREHKRCPTRQANQYRRNKPVSVIKHPKAPHGTVGTKSRIDSHDSNE